MRKCDGYNNGDQGAFPIIAFRNFAPHAWDHQKNGHRGGEDTGESGSSRSFSLKEGGASHSANAPRGYGKSSSHHLTLGLAKLAAQEGKYRHKGRQRQKAYERSQEQPAYLAVVHMLAEQYYSAKVSPCRMGGV